MYACDPKAADPGCGKDRGDADLMCFSGRTLGGTDFCTERCEDGAGLTSALGGVCAQSGARLDTCNLSSVGDGQVSSGDTRSSVAGCDHPALGCFRNNLLSDTGVCLTITPCTEDRECRDPVRSVCATTLVKTVYSQPAVFKNSHLWCLQAGCQERRTACSPGETCLRDVIPAAANPPDICVPTCDSNLRCPPAHFCYRKVSGPAAPNICIPGLLGFRCESTIDCMVGECVSTGQGFNVCATRCGNDADCARFDGEQGKFICNEERFCVTPNAFRGSPCRADRDCGDGLTCAVLTADSTTGNCLPSCDPAAASACPARGGIRHTCLPRADRRGAVCYPGYFGMPCSSDDGCVGGLTCRPVAPGAPRVCTNLCADDGDCQKDRWSEKGFCQEVREMAVKVCLPARKPGQSCERDTQCDSARCVTNAEGAKACSPASTAARP